jgi:pimeloyl-ACP methyl ester carboxylesterase
MTGVDSELFRRRLARAGFLPAMFRYHSTRAPLEEIAARLAATIRASGPLVHVIGHSLGGVIALETYERHADLPPGRVVLMGAPVRGARAAGMLARNALGRQILGPLAMTQLAGRRDRRWTQARELGLVGGSRSFGLGRFFAPLPRPNDGTVALEETELPGAADRLVHDASHIGMLFSAPVAAAVARFLREGRFPPRRAG